MLEAPDPEEFDIFPLPDHRTQMNGGGDSSPEESAEEQAVFEAEGHEEGQEESEDKCTYEHDDKTEREGMGGILALVLRHSHKIHPARPEEERRVPKASDDHADDACGEDSGEIDFTEWEHTKKREDGNIVWSNDRSTRGDGMMVGIDGKDACC